MRWFLPILLLAAACSKATDGVPTPAPRTKEQVLAGRAVEAGVRKILIERYGDNAELVTCPDDQPVKVGHRFTCDVTIDGEQRKVTITVRSAENAEYEVSQPR
ncbi:DUF4333 domain-containing protein [Kibdelosporangium aridum]|uniref:DUF4333 domain-containing protein n=1 Tax=Kibdelosporangium aridum TaxID=2030 RepID=A0A428Z825_KIBAR|nr:DUF4333 domain-containing protein [Kibdelosporangium aridum]RSM83948.1 DUF4333 domain-containing protein [Kibdelosporangium aridum]